MIYISKGISKSSLRKPLKVTRCGKTVQLAGLQAELWRKGQYGFAVIQTKAEELALENLSKAGLAEIQQKSTSTARYYALTCCVLCPTRRLNYGLSAGEKELLCWLKRAGLRMTVAELVYLQSRNIRPTRKLLRARNRQALVEKIYNPHNIADNLLEQQMESADCRDEVVADIPSLCSWGIPVHNRDGKSGQYIRLAKKAPVPAGYHGARTSPTPARQKAFSGRKFCYALS